MIFQINVVLPLALLIFSSYVITYYLVPVCLKIANRWGIKDFPNGSTKLQKEPIPYLGGVALYIGILLPFIVVTPFNNQLIFVLIGSTLLFCAGLIDDVVVINPLQKFIGQFFAVLCFLRAGIYLKEYLFYNMWNIPISIFWMLSIINAFNLIDVMDGLASTVAIGCACNFLLLSLVLHQYAASVLLCTMIGSLLAFLHFNKPRASIYMGDAGSLLLGGLFSIVPFYFSWGKISPFGLLIPLGLLAIPSLEPLGLIIIRTYRGRKFYQASRDHFAHYFKSNGFCENEILLFILFCSLIIGVVTTLFATSTVGLATYMLMGAACLIVWIVLFFFKIR